MSWKCEGRNLSIINEAFHYCPYCGAKKPVKKRRLANELDRLILDFQTKLILPCDSENIKKQYADFLSLGLVEFIGKVYQEWRKEWVEGDPSGKKLIRIVREMRKLIKDEMFPYSEYLKRCDAISEE